MDWINGKYAKWFANFYFYIKSQMNWIYVNIIVPYIGSKNTWVSATYCEYFVIRYNICHIDTYL